MPVTKWVAVNAALGSTWVNMTSRQLSQTGVDGSTPGNICNVFNIEHASSPVLIGIDGTSPTCGLIGSLQFLNEWHSSSPDWSGKNQKLEAVVDGDLPNALNYVSIFSRVIGHKLYDGSSGDLYSSCRMNFVGDFFQNQAPQLMDLGLPDINTLNEGGVLSTSATRIRRKTVGSH